MPRSTSRGNDGAAARTDVPERAAVERESMQPWLGERLRRLRHLRGYSLEDVAKATNISISFLSVVEAGKSDIAISRLMKLVKLYNASVLEVVEPVTDDRVVVRKGKALRFTSDDEGVEVEILLPGPPRRMQPGIFTYQPGEGHKENVVIDGEVFIHVLSGSVALIFNDEETILLGSGDSVYFSGAAPHRVSNVGKRVARTLSCSSPPAVAWAASSR